MVDAGEQSGKEFDICGKLEAWIKEAGFVHVVKETYQVPVDYRPADETQDLLVKYNSIRLDSGWEAYCLRAMTRFLGRSLQQAILDITGFRSAMKDIQKQRQHVTQKL